MLFLWVIDLIFFVSVGLSFYVGQLSFIWYLHTNIVYSAYLTTAQDMYVRTMYVFDILQHSTKSVSMTVKTLSYDSIDPPAFHKMLKHFFILKVLTYCPDRSDISDRISPKGFHWILESFLPPRVEALTGRRRSKQSKWQQPL